MAYNVTPQNPHYNRFIDDTLVNRCMGLYDSGSKLGYNHKQNECKIT